ncbi:death on curing protein [Alkalibacterium putridalgicola]|uniref:Death on curing protein n=1 Tax=Alkalibacterium putridalgicola TaxID=426703 RepID=A0A1H7VP60_9LACT|nr:type II toxin-antitoxin system death-on-curing family toxin [Alkalibacterium putridalgicola]GEK89842.1 death-on-curing protein [Alkalibacterium putridalgicola]SEM11053.1 death on curing protein [Alkalibacterium putridalgicola]
MITLSEKQVIFFNVYLIKKDSPQEFIGVKEPTALNMCLQSIHQTAFGEEVYPTLEEKAAILFINLVKKHCFHNANKRTAFMTLVYFLRINGMKLALPTDEAVKTCLMVATWDKPFDELKEQIVDVIKNNSTTINE